MVDKLYLSPSQSSYSLEHSSNQVIRTQLDGGAGRFRADLINSSKMVNCVWNLDEGEYQYINAFYRTTLQEGSLAFLIDLLLDNPYLQEFTVRIVPGTFKLTTVKGYMYSVSATLEVTQISANAAYNETLVAIYASAAQNNQNYSNIINLLETLTNVNFPDNLG